MRGLVCCWVKISSSSLSLSLSPSSSPFLSVCLSLSIYIYNLYVVDHRKSGLMSLNIYTTLKKSSWKSYLVYLSTHLCFVMSFTDKNNGRSFWRSDMGRLHGKFFPSIYMENFFSQPIVHIPPLPLSNYKCCVVASSHHFSI